MALFWVLCARAGARGRRGAPGVKAMRCLLPSFVVAAVLLATHEASAAEMVIVLTQDGGWGNSNGTADAMHAVRSAVAAGSRRQQQPQHYMTAPFNLSSNTRAEASTAGSAQAGSQTYYVDSASGDDTASGLSPSTALKSLRRASAVALRPGDSMLFARGGVWRGQLCLQGGAPAQTTLYGAYGNPALPKPLFLGSLDASAPSNWRQRGNSSIWVMDSVAEKYAEILGEDLRTAGADFSLRDIGNLILDGEQAVGWRVWALSELVSQDQWYYEASVHPHLRGPQANFSLFFYSPAGNPAVVHKGGIECAWMNFLHADLISIQDISYLTVQDLAVKYTGSSAVGGGNLSHFVLRNCDISWAGGACIQNTARFKRNPLECLRYGNGIDVWEWASNVEMSDNRVWECYDTGFTNQGTSDNYTEKNISYHHNLIGHAEYCFEVWDQNPSARNTSSMSELRIENNVCIDSGGGWSHAQRPDPSGRHICMFRETARVSNVSILNNIFWQSVPYQTAWYMVDMWGHPNASLPAVPGCNGCGWGDSIREDSNVFYQTKPDLGSFIVLGGGWSAFQQVYDGSNFSSYVNATGNSRHSLTLDPLLAGLTATGKATNATDVTPSKHSPVLGKGQPVSWREDFYGRALPRSSPPDIGAVQHQAGMTRLKSDDEGKTSGDLTGQEPRYSCVPPWRLGQGGIDPFECGPGCTEQTTTNRVISTAAETWSVHLGGTADMDTTLTPSAGCKNVTFQPDIELSISNEGTFPIKNPRVVSNGKRKWSTMAGIIAEAHEGAASDTERMFLGWDFLRSLHYHSYPLFGDDELHDPVKYFNMYGTGFCDDAGHNYCSLNWHANFTAANYGQDPKLRSLNGHVQGELYFDGAYHFMDIDENMFYLSHDNSRVASGDDVALDHDLGKREHTWQGPSKADGPDTHRFSGAEPAVALFGRDDVGGPTHVGGHTMDFQLRPNERLVLRWDNIGKVAADHNVSGHHDQNSAIDNGFFGNSRFEWTPNLTAELPAVGAAEAWSPLAQASSGVQLTADGLVADSSEGVDVGLALFTVGPTAWVVCGGNVSVAFKGEGTCGVSIAFDGGSAWQSVWSGSCKQPGTVGAAFDKLIHAQQKPSAGVYGYSLRLQLPTGASARSLKIITDVMAHPLSLPRLQLGSNTMQYTDDSHPPAGVNRNLKISHTYRSSSAIKPLAPPLEPIFPVDKLSMRIDNATFEWPAVTGAVEYHIVVSMREDMKYPFRSQLDTIISEPLFVNPWLGLFSPGVRYYWRVRAKHNAGLWGAWSKTWSFVWDGPGVPTDVKVSTNGCAYAMLSWSASKNVGAAAVAKFEVYGSNETGFTPHRDSRPVLGLDGQQPSNLIATLSADAMPHMLPIHPLANAFYRVVAVSAAGIRGGASAMAAVPRPCIYSCPSERATVGKPYRDTLVPSLAFGDLQYRETVNETVSGNVFAEREGALFIVHAKPSWLTLDAGANGSVGYLSGTPTAIGMHEVAINVSVVYPFDCGGSCDVKGPWRKDTPLFEKSCWHNFTVVVVSEDGTV